MRATDLVTCARLLAEAIKNESDGRELALRAGVPLVLRVTSTGMALTTLHAARALADVLCRNLEGTPVAMLRHSILPVLRDLPDGRHLSLTFASILATTLFVDGACPNSVVTRDDHSQQLNRLLWCQALSKLQKSVLHMWPEIVAGCPRIEFDIAVQRVLSSHVAESVCTPLRRMLSTYLKGLTESGCLVTEMLTSPDIFCCVTGMDVDQSMALTEEVLLFETKSAPHSSGPHSAFVLVGNTEDDEQDDLPVTHLLQILAAACFEMGVTVVYTDVDIDERLGAALGFKIVRVLIETPHAANAVYVKNLMLTREHVVAVDQAVAVGYRTLLVHTAKVPGSSPRIYKLLVGCPQSHGDEIWKQRRDALHRSLRVCQQSTHMVQRLPALVELLRLLISLPQNQAIDTKFILSSLLGFFEVPRRLSSNYVNVYEADHTVVGALCSALDMVIGLLRIDGVVQ